MVKFPPCPNSLKAIQHYLTIASDHDNRDPVISYWCRLHALQEGLKIDKSSAEAKQLLGAIMDWLETERKTRSNDEAVIHDVAAQAHLENYALKLFLWADSQDRASVFNKNVVKGFFTAGIIYSVLELFGELTEEVEKNMKYAKWKAAYIHTCLKNGETPVPGPMDEDDNQQSTIGFVNPAVPGPSSSSVSYPEPNEKLPENPVPLPSTESDIVEEPAASSGSTVTPAVIEKAQKCCKYATSALNYDDVPTAISNLQKALNLLTKGTEN